MSEENKTLVRRIALEVFSEGKLDLLDELIAPDFKEHGEELPGMPAGRAGVRFYAEKVRGAFPDLQNKINMAIAEGDLVVQHVTSTGTMRGEFAGMPPSGKQATWDSVHIGRVRDGKVTEHWVVQDQLGMLQQLGFVPARGEAKTTG
ncbi:MAG: ester cyclase [Nocardioidaceae bacterium]